MYLNFAVASTLIASMFTLSTFYTEAEACDDKERHAAKKVSTTQIEPIVDIHSSSAVLAHPTKSVSSEESVAKLGMLRKQGEAREQERRAKSKEQGKDFPERFLGD